MQRRLYFVAGLVLLATTFATLLTIPQLTVLDQVGTWLVGTGGTLFVMAGWRDEFPLGEGSISWYRLAGVGDVMVGIGLPISLIRSRLTGASSTADVVLFITVAIGGIVLALIGIDLARGGRVISIDTGAEETGDEDTGADETAS